MTTVISIDNLSKSYRLGQIGTGTFAHDLNVWWAKMRGKPNPMLRIGEKDHSHRDGEELWALKDISFTVQQGEVLGIIGRNGAGKSTLLKILSRVTAPTSGRIKVKGRIASLLEVGTGFHPELTGRENTYLNGAILGMRRDEITRKFDEIVDFAGVEKFIDTPVKRYSSGMYVRLAFAVAAHLDPEILIVDEVLAVGDAEFQKKCLGKMGEVAQGGRTVLFVSHNMGAVQQLCNQCVWINHGQIKQTGSPFEIIQSYSRLTMNAASETDLSIKPTKGDGTVKLLSYQVSTNALESSSQALTTNQDVVIRVKIYSEKAIPKPACGISISNHSGILLTSINTVEQGLIFPKIEEGESSIMITLNRVPFLPGNYIASFWVMSPESHIYVMAIDAIAFDLAQSPIYGTRQIDPSWGCVYTKVDFALE